MAPRARHASRQFGRPRPPRYRRRRMDHDRRGIPRRSVAHALDLPPLPQSVRHVAAGPVVSVHHPQPFHLPLGAPARATQCVPHQRRHRRGGHAVDADHRGEGVPDDPGADHAAGWRHRRVDVLRAAPVRRGVLGAPRGLGVLLRRHRGQLLLQAAGRSCTGIPATSAITTSTT